LLVLQPHPEPDHVASQRSGTVTDKLELPMRLRPKQAQQWLRWRPQATAARRVQMVRMVTAVVLPKLAAVC